MNPHDRLVKPPAHRVYEQLGVDDVRTMLKHHPQDSAEAGLARHLAAAATPTPPASPTRLPPSPRTR